MLKGIVSFGGYLPPHRLAREEIRRTLGQGGGKGTRAVAGYDEDTPSMGVEAARLARWDNGFAPVSVHFATTAPAYADKTNANAVHAALGLPQDVFATDHAGSVRSAVGALRAAGAGDGVIAEILAEASATAEFLDRWRVPGEQASSVWEERFGLGVYLPLIWDAAGRALAAAGVEQPDHLVVSSPHARAAKAAAKAFGDAAVERVEPVAGNLGAAHSGVQLVDALERATAGQTILVVSAADGADALLLRVTDAIANRPDRPGVLEQFANAADVDYATFLTWRGVLKREPPRRPDPLRPEGPPAQRAATWKFGFVGTRCRACDRVHVPPVRVCAGCGTTDEMDPEPMADRAGTVATYTIDRLAYSLSPPVVTAAVDFDGGGRFSCELTDCTPEQIEVGTRVRMSFRRMHTAGGVHNYFWKGQPMEVAEHGE